MKPIQSLLNEIAPDWRSRSVNHPIVHRPQLSKQDITVLRVSFRSGYFHQLIGASKANVNSAIIIDGVPYVAYN